MNKTLLIIAREYLTRVKKKSFLILTLLGPILMAAMIVIPVLVAENTGRDAKVLVVGAGGLGAPVSLYLAAAGVGTIGIIDG